MIIREIVYTLSNEESTISGKKTHNKAIYIIKIPDTFEKNFWAAANISFMLSVSLLAIGLYNKNWTIPPTPASIKDIYAKNWVIDEISPLTSEP